MALWRLLVSAKGWAVYEKRASGISKRKTVIMSAQNAARRRLEPVNEALGRSPAGLPSQPLRGEVK